MGGYVKGQEYERKSHNVHLIEEPTNDKGDGVGCLGPGNLGIN